MLAFYSLTHTHDVLETNTLLARRLSSLGVTRARRLSTNILDLLSSCSIDYWNYNYNKSGYINIKFDREIILC